jgi:hypothetical protein
MLSSLRWPARRANTTLSKSASTQVSPRRPPRSPQQKKPTSSTSVPRLRPRSLARALSLRIKPLLERGQLTAAVDTVRLANPVAWDSAVWSLLVKAAFESRHFSLGDRLWLDVRLLLFFSFQCRSLADGMAPVQDETAWN